MGYSFLNFMIDDNSRLVYSETARAGTYPDWIHSYNHHRPHTTIGGKSPIDRVHNVNGKNRGLADG